MTAPQRDVDTRAWSAFVCGDPGDGTLLIVDWLVLAAAIAGRSARAVAIDGSGAHPHGMLVQVAAPGNDAGLLDLPAEGVDLLVAGEHMELARALAAGWADPQRTTIVASTRRRFEHAERIVDAPFVLRERQVADLAARCAHRYVAFDGPEVSGWYSLPAQAAPGLLLGAIDGAAATSFETDHLLAAIASLDVDARMHSLAFGRGVRLGRRDGGRKLRTVTSTQFARRRRQALPRSDRATFTALVAAIDAEFPQAARTSMQHGVHATCDFLDADWAVEFVERCRGVARELRVVASREPGREHECDALLADYARGLANLMCYTDVAHAAHVRLRSGRAAELRKRHGLGRDESWQVVDHIAVERGEVSDLHQPRVRLPGTARAPFDPNAAPTDLLLAGVDVEAIDAATVGGVARLRKLARLRSGRRDSRTHVAEIDAVDSFTSAVIESAHCDLDLARIAVASASLVEGSGAVRVATRTAARVFWGRVIRPAFAVDRAAHDVDMRFSRLVIPFVWNEIAASGTLALWEHAGKVVGISLHAARGGTHEQALEFARALAAPQARRSPAIRALLDGPPPVLAQLDVHAEADDAAPSNLQDRLPERMPGAVGAAATTHSVTAVRELA